MIGKTIKVEPVDEYKKLCNENTICRLVCGKWFINENEYSLYGANGFLFELMKKDYQYFKVQQHQDAFIKFMINVVSEEEGEWPEMPILTKAKEKFNKGIKPAQGYNILNLSDKELQILNYLLVGSSKDTYAIFFYGIGGSGKSTVCNLYASIFGRNDSSYCHFDDLSNVFSREDLAGKRLWYDDDILSDWSDKQTGTFKKIVTHSLDQFQKKGQNPYSAQYRAKPLFCCNTPPRFDITDEAILRRILYYKKNTKIENPIGDFAQRKWTQEELEEYVLAALYHPFNFKNFEKETHEVIMETNSVGKWGMQGNYDAYLIACQANYVHPFGIEKYNKLRRMFEQWQLE